eukprot:m.225151 g.225151  ORF g.225151 m.225151 type:complete len:153 (-) comp54206_c0_seq33:293-751(-)
MTYAFGPDWHDAFDVIVFNSRKPSFFSSTRVTSPFRKLLDNHAIGEEVALEQGIKVLHGNVADLHDFLEMFKDGPTAQRHVAYFGDHILGDIVAARRHTSWQTIAIVEEMLFETTPQVSADSSSSEILTIDREVSCYFLLCSFSNISSLKAL